MLLAAILVVGFTAMGNAQTSEKTPSSSATATRADEVPNTTDLSKQNAAAAAAEQAVEEATNDQIAHSRDKVVVSDKPDPAQGLASYDAHQMKVALNEAENAIKSLNNDIKHAEGESAARMKDKLEYYTERARIIRERSVSVRKN